MMKGNRGSDAIGVRADAFDVDPQEVGFVGISGNADASHGPCDFLITEPSMRESSVVAVSANGIVRWDTEPLGAEQ